MTSLVIFVCMFYTFFLTGARQSLAMVVLLLSYNLLKKRKYFLFIVAVLFASLFHQTALIFLLLPIIKLAKGSGKFLLISLVSYVVVFLTRNQIFELMKSAVEKYGDYEAYEAGEAITYTIMLLLISVGAIFIGQLNKNSDTSENQEYFFLTNVILLGFAMMPMIGVNPSLLRVVMYFSIFVCILVIKIYDKIEVYTTRVIVQMITLGVVVVLFINELEGSSYLYEMVTYDDFANW